jgi:hypothetical protein
LSANAILSQDDNATLSAQGPFDSWRGLCPNQKECASLQLCFTAKEKLLLHAAFEEFVNFRSEKLADQLNKFIGLGC